MSALKTDSRAAFIGECKLWAGPASLTRALDQLLRYLTWRDGKASVIVFNTRNRDFSKILPAIPDAIRGHGLFLRDLPCEETGEWARPHAERRRRGTTGDGPHLPVRSLPGSRRRKGQGIALHSPHRVWSPPAWAMTMTQTMANPVPFGDVPRQIQTTLSTWEEAVDRAKKPRSRYIATIGWKGMAALLQYNISLRTARLGATLLESSLDNRRDGLLFGLTKRPMFESYTRGMWLEFVADEDFAESFLIQKPRRRRTRLDHLGQQAELSRTDQDVERPRQEQDHARHRALDEGQEGLVERLHPPGREERLDGMVERVRCRDPQ